MWDKRLEDREEIAMEEETTHEIDIKNGCKIVKHCDTMDYSTTCVGRLKCTESCLLFTL